METFLKEVEERLRENLGSVDGGDSTVNRYAKKIMYVEAAITEIKDCLVSYTFSEKADEIQYLKYGCIPFFKLHIYYLAMYDVEIVRGTCTESQLLQWLESERTRVVSAFSEHQELYRYYKSGRCHQDELYFTFKAPSGTIDFLVANGRFCKASLIVSELLAYEEYRVVLDNELKQIKCPTMPVSRIKVKVPKAAIVEIIIAVYELEMIWIEGRPATLNELIRIVENAFGIDLKDFGVIDNSNRYRKKSTTPWLDKMITVSNNRRERLDP